MTLYEIIIAAAASANLAMNLVLFIANRHKAASEKVDKLAELVDTHARNIAALQAYTEGAPSHQDLGAVYGEVNTTRQMVERLSGEIEHMNANLRLLLTQLVNNGKGG